MANVIFITDTKDIGAQIQAALSQAGIDASQFGNLQEQIQSAFAAAGLAQEQTVEAPVEEEVGPAFGERTHYNSDASGSSLTFFAPAAQDINIFKNANGNLEVQLVDSDGEPVSEEFGVEAEDDLAAASSFYNGETLTVFVPKTMKFEIGDSIEVEGFEADSADEDVLDSDEQDADEGEWCDECQEYHND